jgi:hypothetical protein
MGSLVCCIGLPNICFVDSLDYPGPFNDAALDIIRANPHVQSVSEDGIMRVADVQYVAIWLKLMFHADSSRTNTTWGLHRISNPQRLPEGSSPS